MDYSEGFPSAELQLPWFEKQVELACKVSDYCTKKIDLTRLYIVFFQRRRVAVRHVCFYTRRRSADF